jgi:hypothetical protein
MSDQDRNASEQWQAMFQPSIVLGMWQQSAHAFWKAQSDMLDGMQAFAEGWFQRRHLGAQAASEACERMCAAKNPVEWFHEYQTWCAGASQRLMADGLGVRDCVGRVTAELSPSVIPSSPNQQDEGKPSGSKARARAEA